MKSKRLKANRKTLQIYTRTFGFREPFQVLLDAEFVISCVEKKMDIVNRLSSLLGSSQIRLMMTSCTISSLYSYSTTLTTEEVKRQSIELIKSHRNSSLVERRKCSHTPLQPFETCMSGIIGQQNSLHYIVCTQQLNFRSTLRTNFTAVPLIYLNKGAILILEAEGPKTELERLKKQNGQLHVSKSELELLQPSGDEESSGIHHKPTPHPRTSTTATTSLPLSVDQTSSASKLAKKLLQSHQRYKSSQARKAKAPNPLSVKKKKSTAKGKQPRPGKVKSSTSQKKRGK